MSQVQRYDHELIIDEYYQNGLNAVQAVQKLYPELKYQQAANLGHQVVNSPKNAAYIKTKQNQMRTGAAVSPMEIARELKNIAFGDVTAFMGLDENQIRDLPPAIRRTLHKVTIKKKKTTLPDGTEISENTYTYGLNDRLRALDMLAKYIGFYEVDNRQKANQVNVLNILEKADPKALNALEKAMRSIEIDPK